MRQKNPNASLKLKCWSELWMAGFYSNWPIPRKQESTGRGRCFPRYTRS